MRILSTTDEQLFIWGFPRVCPLRSTSGSFASVKNQTLPIYICHLVTLENLSTSVFLYNPPPSPFPPAKASSTDICAGLPMPAVKSFGTRRCRMWMPTLPFLLLFPLQPFSYTVCLPWFCGDYIELMKQLWQAEGWGKATDRYNTWHLKSESRKAENKRRWREITKMMASELVRYEKLVKEFWLDPFFGRVKQKSCPLCLGRS